MAFLGVRDTANGRGRNRGRGGFAWQNNFSSQGCDFLRFGQ